jgi:hypothetical protein
MKLVQEYFKIRESIGAGASLYSIDLALTDFFLFLSQEEKVGVRSSGKSRDNSLGELVSSNPNEAMYSK